MWIDHPWFLSKVWGQTGSKLYGAKSGADYVDNQSRFALFCRAAIESLRALPFGPGEECVIVANDWHTALVPVSPAPAPPPLAACLLRPVLRVQAPRLVC